MIKRIASVAIVMVITVWSVLPTYAEEYDVLRSPDGNFSFQIGTVTLNEGSSLEKEAIILNEPSCPIQIKSTSFEIIYSTDDRSFHFIGTSEANLLKEIRAFEIRYVTYDVFGMHIENLKNLEVKDFEAGETTFSGEWRVRESHINEFLTSVTFIGRVRLVDGTQWVADMDQLGKALSNLNLERKLDNEDTEDSGKQ